MTKPILKLGFTDTIESISEFFIDTLSVDFQIVRDDANPDYLIFGDRNFGNRNESYTNCTKIFYTGENQRPWDYKCHYAITFDHFDATNHYRLPLYVIYDWDNKRKDVSNSSYKLCFHNDAPKNAKERGFCSFIVKNGSCQKRNDFFHKLSQYKQVTSAGPLFNNTGTILEGGANAVQAKLAYLPKFKFNLCFENASYPGYATEKLYEALVGNTVPIYWGSPTIALDFNPNAFLNWHDFQDDDKLIEAIKEVDSSYSTWNYLISQPIWVHNPFADLNRFRFWFRKNVFKG